MSEQPISIRRESSPLQSTPNLPDDRPDLHLVTDGEPIEAKIPSNEAFTDRIAELRDFGRAEGSSLEAREAAWTKFVDQEASPQLALFSGVMLRAAFDVDYKNAYDNHKESIKSIEGLSVPELKETQLRMREAKTFLIESDHLLRKLIEEQGEYFTLTELTNWFTQANGGKAKTAEERVYAAATEAAVMSALKEMPEILEVQYGTVDQDSKGGDIVATFLDPKHGDKEGPKEAWIDVKAGKQMPKAFMGPVGLHLTIGIPTNLMDSHGKLDDRDKEGVQVLIGLAINQSRLIAKQRSSRWSEAGVVGMSESIHPQLSLTGVLNKLRGPKDVFQPRAEMLLDEIRRGLAKNEINDVTEALKEKYLHDSSDDIELQRLTQIILIARQQAMLQSSLNADRQHLHEADLSHEEKVSVGTHYEMLRSEACSFNHALRTLMENNGQHFTRAQLTEWIGKASQGHYKWAEGEVAGAASEIAVHAALQGLTELKGVRYGTVEEDLAGYDFVAEWNGQLLSVDAKTGHYPPVEENKHGHRHIEVSVPREVIEDFTVTKHGLEVIRFDIRHALQQEQGTVLHVSHHHYPKVSS